MLKRRSRYRPNQCDSDCRKTFQFYSSVVDADIEALRYIKSKCQNDARDIKLASKDFFRESQRRLKNTVGKVHNGILLDPNKKGVTSTLKAYFKELQYHHGDNTGDANVEHFGPCKKTTSSFVKEGMKSILKPLTKHFKPDTVRFNNRIAEIDFTTFNKTEVRNQQCGASEPVIKVTSSNGRKFYANHVIVAIPLGHLKRKASSLFCPSLSKLKLDAIEAMGFGSVGKAFLHFEKPVSWKGFELFWSKEDRSKENSSDVTCVTSDTDDGDTASYVNDNECLVEEPENKEKGPSEKNKGEEIQINEENNNNEAVTSEWLKDIQDKLVNFSSKPNSRLVQATFTDAIVEDIPDHELAMVLTSILRDVLYMELPKVVKITKTNWKKNSLFKGTHPYLKAKNCPNLSEVLSRPITFRCRPVIQFAGDYTYDLQPYLLHGARVSGIREATRLANFYDYQYGWNNRNLDHYCDQ